VRGSDNVRVVSQPQVVVGTQIDRWIDTNLPNGHLLGSIEDSLHLEETFGKEGLCVLAQSF
jgi:hypothetical protein